MDALPQLPAQPTLAIGLALIAVSLLGALGLVVRRRRGVAVAVEPSEVESDPDLQPVPESEQTADQETDAEPGSTSVTIRALRAQVRVLEEALASAPAQCQEGSADVAAYRRQVRCAVQAVALGADDQVRYAVARVAAAIDRLDAPEAFVRPVLPIGPLARVETGERRASLVAVAPLVEAVVPEPVVLPEPVEAPPAASAPPVLQSPEPASVVEPEVVLPVPPPAPAATRRSRRRLRHPAA